MIYTQDTFYSWVNREPFEVFRTRVEKEHRRRFRSVRHKISVEMRRRMRDRDLLGRRVITSDGVTFEAVQDIIKETFDHFVKLGYVSYPKHTFHCNFEVV